MSSVFQKGAAKVEANLTPMIDVTFLLIVFFVLVSQIVEVENVAMSLPEPEDALTEIAGEDQRAVINVIPAPGGGVAGYRLGTHTHRPGPEGLSTLSAALSNLYATNPKLAVNLRADRATQYDHVEPVLEAISSAAAAVPDATISARVNLVVVRPDS